MSSTESGTPGLTIASLRNMAAGFPPDTPLLVPGASGEGYEPLVMASAVHVGTDLTATTPTAAAGRLVYVLLTAAEREREREKRARANLPPTRAPRAP